MRTYNLASNTRHWQIFYSLLTFLIISVDDKFTIKSQNLPKCSVSWKHGNMDWLKICKFNPLDAIRFMSIWCGYARKLNTGKVPPLDDVLWIVGLGVGTYVGNEVGSADDVAVGLVVGTDPKIQQRQNRVCSLAVRHTEGEMRHGKKLLQNHHLHLFNNKSF